MDDFFVCKQCKKEHEEMIKMYGNGYSYLGQINNCARHNNNVKTNVNKSPLPDWLKK